jgi:hypothetical protein
MADKGITVGFMTTGLGSEARYSRDALVAAFRGALSGLKSPLESIPAEELEQARREFREHPEVAGEPLPSPGDLESKHLVETLRDEANKGTHAEAAKRGYG